jgi:hypothetical protein
MSKRSTYIISITGIIAFLCALLMPMICTTSMTGNFWDFTNYFGIFTTFGGPLSPKGVDYTIYASFNIGAFIILVFMLAGDLLVFFLGRKQVTAIVLNMILHLISGIMLIFSQFYFDRANGVLSGFTAYETTGFGAYVAMALCFLVVIESIGVLYVMHSDAVRSRPKSRR